MKQPMVLGMVLLLMASLAVAGPKVNKGTWSSDDVIKTKSWKEAFIGGGPGQAGNELTAVGTGLQFSKAVLQSVGCAPNEGATSRARPPMWAESCS